MDINDTFTIIELSPKSKTKEDQTLILDRDLFFICRLDTVDP